MAALLGALAVDAGVDDLVDVEGIPVVLVGIVQIGVIVMPGSDQAAEVLGRCRMASCMGDIAADFAGAVGAVGGWGESRW